MYDIDFEFVSSVLEYDKATGIFRWIKDIGNGNYKGDKAGTFNQSGAFVIGLNYKVYQASRIAHLLTTGDWPCGNVKFADGDKGNLKWSNLVFRFKDVSGKKGNAEK